FSGLRLQLPGEKRREEARLRASARKRGGSPYANARLLTLASNQTLCGPHTWENWSLLGSESGCRHPNTLLGCATCDVPAPSGAPVEPDLPPAGSLRQETTGSRVHPLHSDAVRSRIG